MDAIFVEDARVLEKFILPSGVWARRNLYSSLPEKKKLGGGESVATILQKDESRQTKMVDGFFNNI